MPCLSAAHVVAGVAHPDERISYRRRDRGWQPWAQLANQGLRETPVNVQITNDKLNYQNHPLFLNHQMVTPVVARVIAMAI
jgi:hypothetical protein